ncbi:MAG: TonB family protein [Syntrophales bacterium]|nr:TonB family protein [Syntrophales bacterium]
MEPGLRVLYIAAGTVNDMITKKIFLTTIALSLAVHIAVLALVGFLGSSDGQDGEDVFTVTLERRPDGTAAKHGSEGGASAAAEKLRERAKGNRVDTVDLDSTDTKYYPYLLHVRESIDRQWSYPDDAFTRGETGTTVVEFSIEQEGSLATCRAIVSSGHESLDTESLRAVRSAAPFTPFSEEFGLVRLNIVAKFSYTLAE